MSRPAIGGGVALACLIVTSIAAAAPPTVPQCLDASEQGQAMRDQGKLALARELFSTCVAMTCPGPVRVSCNSWLEAVIAKTPSIIIVVRDDADRDVAGASVIVDGAARTTVSGKPLELDPGSHTLTVEAPGHAAAKQSFVANLGEKNRLIRIGLETSASPVSAVPTSSPAPRPTPQPAPPPSSSASTATVPPLAIGLGALALGSIGASLFIGLDARSDLSDLRASPCGSSRTCDASATDELRTRFIIADVLIGVSAVAAAAAIWIWLSAPSPATKAGLRRGTPRAGVSF
jgi:hypothetical protein